MTGDEILRPVRPGTGTFDVTIGPRRCDRLMALAAGQRRSGQVPVSMAVETVPGSHRPPRERWIRTIDGRRMATTAVWGEPVVEDASVAGAAGAGARVVTEWLGPLGLVFRLGSAGQRVTMDLTGARLGTSRRSLPLPAALFPPISAVAGPAVPAVAAGPEPDGWWVRVEMRSRRGRSILIYEGVLT